MKKEGKISILNFISKQVSCVKNNILYPLKIKNNYEDYLSLYYFTNGNNGSKRENSLIIPKYINRNKETFEVLGLLQAEMGKTNNGAVVFCNHEYRLIKKVMKWFEKEFELLQDEWRWSIKVNINEPKNVNYKKEIENKVINHWLSKTKIKENMRYPKTVTYIKNTKNKRLKKCDYGSLIIEHKSNLFSQIIKNFVKLMSYNMLNFENDYIKSFMKSIIAGEGTVENYKPDKRYRIFISVSKKEEKELYYQLLKRLDIKSIKYKGDKLIISKRENLVKLLKQRLMCLSPKKYNKFLVMMQQYPGITEETGYFSKNMVPWNKCPQEIIDKIIKIYYQNTSVPAWKIAEQVGINVIKVNRVLKEKNLGKRLIKTSENIRKDIAMFAKENSHLRQYKIAKEFNVHDSIVRRAIKKYS